jgi:hypothetical protein
MRIVVPTVSVLHGLDVVSVPLSGVLRRVDISVSPYRNLQWNVTDVIDDDCDCILPSSAPDSGDSHARRSLICPTGQSSCLINPGFSKQTECLDLRTTLDSCGGCTSQGEGLDCTQIPNVEDVSCEYGACKIYSCERGFKLENGTACVPDSEYKGIKNLLTGASVGSGKVWTF